MSDTLSLALLITAIGMSLVFASILVLWALMAILVKLANRPSKDDQAKLGNNSNSPNKLNDIHEERNLAAIVAVSIALAKQHDGHEPKEFPLPPTALISAWQAVMRTKMHTKRGSVR
jgi:Na+-transporting methylmalonyl-CoA/oxaloacetate decarboxylase gamma subunit